jgi:hypothetical protein
LERRRLVSLPWMEQGAKSGLIMDIAPTKAGCPNRGCNLIMD